MPLFTYTARTRSGEKTDGTIEANDRRQALMQIERKGYVPVSVKEGSGPSSNGAKKKAPVKKG